MSGETWSQLKDLNAGALHWPHGKVTQLNAVIQNSPFNGQISRYLVGLQGNKQKQDENTEFCRSVDAFHASENWTAWIKLPNSIIFRERRGKITSKSAVCYHILRPFSDF